MNTILRDVRFGARSLLKQPHFSIVAVVTLALGIGATTTIFSILNGLVLRPPAIAEPDRVVAIWKTPQGNHVEGLLSYLDLQDWRRANHSFEDIAAYKPSGIILTDRQESDRISGTLVTANFFPLLKVNPVLGRNFDVQQPQVKAQGSSYGRFQVGKGGLPPLVRYALACRSDVRYASACRRDAQRSSCDVT